MRHVRYFKSRHHYAGSSRPTRDLASLKLYIRHVHLVRDSPKASGKSLMGICGDVTKRLSLCLSLLNQGRATRSATDLRASDHDISDHEETVV